MLRSQFSFDNSNSSASSLCSLPSPSGNYRSRRGKTVPLFFHDFPSNGIEQLPASLAMHQFSPLTTTYFFASHQQSGNTSSSKPLSLGPYPSYIQQQQRYIGESMETTGVLPPVFGVPFLPCPNYPPPIPNPEVFSPQGRVPLKEHNGEDGEDVPTNKMESLNLSPKDTSSVEGRFEGLPIFVIPQSGPQAGVLLPNAYKRAMEFKINALASREQRAKETTAGDTERTKNSRFQIFVGNLSSETDNKELKELAEQFGDVSEVKIVYDSSSRGPRAFGFVTYSNREEAERAKRGMNGLMLRKRNITANWAKNTERTSSPNDSILRK